MFEQRGSIEMKNVPEKWRHLSPQTLRVLEMRGYHDWREDKYHAIVPEEQGKSGPICVSTVYGIVNAEEAATIFSGKGEGYLYPRISCGTPPISELSNMLLDLEFGRQCEDQRRYDYECLLFASGMAAISNLIFALCDDKRSVVVSPCIYGGSYQFFNEVCPRHSIEVIMIDDPLEEQSWLDGIGKAQRPTCLFAEDDSNPLMLKLDNKMIARIAHEHGLLYICDRTIGTPILEKPLAAADMYESADIAVHSASKNMNGFSEGLGGVVIAPRNIAKIIKNLYLPTLGAIMSPWNADRILFGLRTLEERIDVKVANAQFIADWLACNNKVRRVRGPRADMIAFLVDGDKATTQRIFESARLIVPAAHLGDIQSLWIHCASTTHARVPEKLRQTIGIEDNMIRLSAGLEDPLDIVNDIQQAFQAI